MAVLPIAYLTQVETVEVSPTIELATTTGEISAPGSGTLPSVDPDSERSGSEVLAAAGLVLPTTTTTTTTTTVPASTTTTTVPASTTTVAPVTTTTEAAPPPMAAALETTTTPPSTTTTSSSTTTTAPPATTTTVSADPLGILDPPSNETTSEYSNRDEGVASWFGAPEATCAHVEIPKGTVIKVTRIDTGVSTTCVVNDWGPADRSRIIDLSDDTFEKLAPLSVGLIDVVIEW